jgi:MoaA/NifB/PqqE/SkfB family radical SAM enzyme
MTQRTGVSLDILQDYNASRQCVDKGAICHAPESSMYFGRDGLVSSCCYSRPNPLGRYPDQSIEEIWNGAQVTSMRAAMRRNELPDGFELCFDQFYARNFSGFLARQFDANARPLTSPGLLSRATGLLRPGKAKRYPVRLEFELSNKCNLECSMCSGFFSSSIRSNRENLPALPQMYDKAFVEQLVPFLPHLTSAKFLGGEPFLVDLYYEIWERLMELNPACDVSITTNGTVFTDKVKRVLEKLNCQIIVSLDSVTKATYETIRKNATMERTLANLESFSAINRLKNKSLSLAICPMTSNCREIPGLVAFANERDMRVFFNTVIFPDSHSIKALPLAEQREILELYSNFNQKPRTQLEMDNHEALQGVCRQIKYWMREDPAERCAELLAARKESDSVARLLSDLAGKNLGESGAPLVNIEGANPVHELRDYVQAIWEVGGMLQTSGLLKDLNFDADALRIFVRHIERNVGREQAREVYLGMRRDANKILRFSGKVTAPKMMEIIESYPSAAGQSKG